MGKLSKQHVNMPEDLVQILGQERSKESKY